MDDFEAMIAALRELIDRDADELYRRIVADMREHVVELCVLREKLRKE